MGLRALNSAIQVLLYDAAECRPWQVQARCQEGPDAAVCCSFWLLSQLRKPWASMGFGRMGCTDLVDGQRPSWPCSVQALAPASIACSSIVKA